MKPAPSKPPILTSSCSFLPLADWDVNSKGNFGSYALENGRDATVWSPKNKWGRATPLTWTSVPQSVKWTERMKYLPGKAAAFGEPLLLQPSQKLVQLLQVQQESPCKSSDYTQCWRHQAHCRFHNRPLLSGPTPTLREVRNVWLLTYSVQEFGLNGFPTCLILDPAWT